MKIRVLLKFVLSALYMATAFGCGGGGSSPPPPQPPTTIIAGMAAKGPIAGGKVEVFKIDQNGNDIPTTALGSDITESDGTFNIDIGSYQGAIMLRVTGGSYTDEVSGATVTLLTPLRALYANAVTGTNKVTITPLTDLAYRKAKGEAGNTPLTHTSIDDANTRIASIFGLTDIISTHPLLTAAADDNQKEYAVVLGSFSQFLNDNKSSTDSLAQALSNQLLALGNDIVINNGNFSTANMALINESIVKYNLSIQPVTPPVEPPPVTPPVEPPPVTPPVEPPPVTPPVEPPPVTPPVEPPPVTPPVEPPPVVPPPVIPPIAPVPTIALLKLSSTGGIGEIGAINLTFTLPEGVTLKADANGQTLNGVVAASGVATGNNVFTVAKYTPSDGTTPGKVVISLINNSGFGAGEFIAISFDITGAPPVLGGFIKSGLNATDTGGRALNGFLTVTGALELK